MIAILPYNHWMKATEGAPCFRPRGRSGSSALGALSCFVRLHLERLCDGWTATP